MFEQWTLMLAMSGFLCFSCKVLLWNCEKQTFVRWSSLRCPFQTFTFGWSSVKDCFRHLWAPGRISCFIGMLVIVLRGSSSVAATIYCATSADYQRLLKFSSFHLQAPLSHRSNEAKVLVIAAQLFGTIEFAELFCSFFTISFIAQQ